MPPIHCPRLIFLKLAFDHSIYSLSAVLKVSLCLYFSLAFKVRLDLPTSYAPILFPSTHLCSLFWELASGLYSIVHLKSLVLFCFFNAL